MMDNVTEKRKEIKEDVCELELKISKREFFIAYDEIDIHSGYDFLKKYLIYKNDSGVPDRLETSYVEEEKIITISTILHYLEDDDEEYL